MLGFRFSIGIHIAFRHWKSGEILVKDFHTATVTQRNHHTTRFYRPHLLDALAENLPQDILHFHKRLLNVEVRPEGASLDFEDGERFEADLVVGADGIKSVSHCRPLVISNQTKLMLYRLSARATFPSSSYSSQDRSGFVACFQSLAWTI